MQIQEHKQGAVTVLKPHGPLTQEDAGRFKDRLGRSLSASLGRCVVDAGAVPFVDSRGLEVLVEVTDELSRNGQALKLCSLNETLREVLELTTLAHKFEHFADVHTAVRSFL